jgi:CheY-like chemotaxis protein
MTSRIELLLVEDTPSDIRLTEEALKDASLDYHLSITHDGEEAMNYLNSKKSSGEKLPDLILLDLNMPKKNGHEVLADISRDSTLKTIPVILLTVSQRDEDIQEALKLKMNYYLCKPISADTIQTLIHAIFNLNSEEATASAGEEMSKEEIHVRYVMASNPHTSPWVLKRLAQEKNYKLRAKVAENPRTPIEIIEQLASDLHPDVRVATAENENTPEHILEKLSKDESDDVRLGIAENHRIPSRILQTLAADKNTFVSSSAEKSLAK